MESAGTGAGSSTLATNVAREGVTSQALAIGRPLAFMHSPFLLCGFPLCSFRLEFQTWFHLVSPPQLLDLPLADQMDVDATIEETAKDAAAKVAADEAAKDVHEEAAKGSAGEVGKETGCRTGGIPAVGVPGATSVPESSAAGETVIEDQPPTSKPPPQADI